MDRNDDGKLVDDEMPRKGGKRLQLGRHSATTTTIEPKKTPESNLRGLVFRAVNVNMRQAANAHVRHRNADRNDGADSLT